jgi:hypothetical protein
MLGGQDYKIPSGSTSIEDLAKKLDIDESLALSVAKHAAATYATVRPASGAKDRQKPPQKWIDLVTQAVEEPSPQTRVEVFQEVEELEPLEPMVSYTVHPKSREEIYNRSLRDNN